MDSIFSNLAKSKNLKNESFHKSIDKYANNEQQKLSLSQKAILLINSVPEVTTTLVGMKSVNYIDDVLKSIKSEVIVNFSDYWHDNGSYIQ
jgi:aryl-alcohol dehydrogenase-like predicted oxidoreductase